MNSQKNSTIYLNAPSEVISSQTSQHLAWPVSPDEITDTALLASYLREGSRHATEAMQLDPYHELAQLQYF